MNLKELMETTKTTRKEMDEVKDLVRLNFKNSHGEPFIMTNGQAIIFNAIARRKFPRVHIETPTRYGKSDIISMAVEIRAASYPEKWSIVAGNKEKASIIMSYAIGHLFDSPYIHRKFILEKGESEENIRRYRNKDRINFDLGGKKLGEMFICSAPDALGFGAPNVIEDESALVKTRDHALVMRMLGDQQDNFICKVGNPFESEHFDNSFKDKDYVKIIIDYKLAIQEGRLTPAYIDEMRKQPFFNILYEVKRPILSTADDQGWIQLLSREEVENAMVDPRPGFGINKLGVDVAGGGRNFSEVVLRHTNIARIVHRSNNPDTMSLAEIVIGMAKIPGSRKFLIEPNDISIDKVGIGRGCYEIVNREIPGVWGINGGAKPTDKYEEEKYINLRAQLYWKTREWIIAGGKLERHDDWYQLARVKYKITLEGRRGKIQIMSKEEMLRNGIESPDAADALMMTFMTPDIPPIDEEEAEMEETRKGGFDPYNPFGLEI
jgi:hypothetical protein